MLAKMKEFQRTIKLKKTLEMTKMISSPFSKSQFEDSIRFFNVSHKDHSSLEYTLVP